jgi:hypothetical protein
VIRVTNAYDEASKDVIIGDYARYTHSCHKCSEDTIKAALRSTVDLLWATSPA